MKKFMKLAAFVLSAVMVLSLAACGENKALDGDAEVTLKWVMPGPGKQKDSDFVWAKFNEELKKIPGFKNTTVNIDVIPVSEYRQKFMLMLTSNEQVDIANTYTLPYADYARDDTFVELTPKMIDQYLPDTKKEIPEWVFDMMMVDGKHYAVTSYQQMATMMNSLVFQEEEADKYLDKEKLQKLFFDSKTVTKELYDAVEEYLAKLKANNELDLGMYPAGFAEKGYIRLGYNFLQYLPREDGKVIVENFAETDALKIHMHAMSDLFKKGYIREDVLSAEAIADKGKKNGYNLWYEQDYKGAEEAMEKQYGMKLTFVKPQPNYFIAINAAAGGNAIVTTCENPEKALSLLNIINSSKGKDLYQLLVYGEKDKHYKILDDGRMEPIGYNSNTGDSNAPYGIYKWIVGNTANSFETVYDTEGWNDYVFNDWNKNAIVPDMVGFKFDTTGLETEMGQLQTIYGDYIVQLDTGATRDVDATYEEFIAKMKAAGIDKVVAEMQKQVDEFLANK